MAYFHVVVIKGDPTVTYSSAQIHAMLKEAERQGHPLDSGSYLESMTIRQLDMLIHGRTDC